MMRRSRSIIAIGMIFCLTLCTMLTSCKKEDNLADTDIQTADDTTASDEEGEVDEAEGAKDSSEDDKAPEKPKELTENEELLTELIAAEEARVKEFDFLNVKENEANTYQVNDVFEVQFDLTEEFENGDMFNPNIVDIGAYVTTPSGESVKAIGFYKQDESPKWAFRYNPTETGTYTYYLADEKNDTAKTEIMSFDATKAGENRGRLRVEGNKILDKNGDQFIPVGTNLLDYPLYNNDSYSQSFATIIPKLAKEGGANLLRVWGEYHAGSFQLELAEGTYFECGLSQSFQGLGQYNLENAGRMDGLLKILEENNMYMNLCMFNQWSFGTNFSKNAYNEAMGGMCVSQGGSTDFWSNELALKWQEQLIRYYSARYSASRAFAIFEYWNEVDSSAKAYSDAYTYKWLSRMDELWKSINVNGVITSSSYAWKDHSDQGVSPWIKYDFIDLAQTHYYIGRGTDPVMSWVDTINGTHEVYEGPVFIGEFSEDGAEAFTDEQMNEFEGMSDYYMLEGFWSPVFFANAAGANIFWKINQNFIPNERCLQFMKVFSDTVGYYADLLAKADFKYYGVEESGIQMGGYLSPDGVLLFARDTAANDSGETVTIADETVESVPYLTKNPRSVSTFETTVKDLDPGTYQITYMNIENGSIVEEKEETVVDGSLTLNFPSFQRGIFVSVIKK